MSQASDAMPRYPSYLALCGSQPHLNTISPLQFAQERRGGAERLRALGLARVNE